MELTAVRKTYARWAPIYDATFGRITGRARAQAVRYINQRGGAVLEVGVGTGLALDRYGPDLQVTGIDFSEAMLDKARARVRDRRLAHVRQLRQMDARRLDFADASFDTVAAMHVLSVVPEPARVMAEIARVLRPGGEVVIVNHFAREKGVLAALERWTAPMSGLLGWHSDFPMALVSGEATLQPVFEAPVPPFRMMTLLVLRKA